MLLIYKFMDVLYLIDIFKNTILLLTDENSKIIDASFRTAQDDKYNNGRCDFAIAKKMYRILHAWKCYKSNIFFSVLNLSRGFVRSPTF